MTTQMMDALLYEAMIEVDSLTPGSEPLAPRLMPKSPELPAARPLILPPGWRYDPCAYGFTNRKGKFVSMLAARLHPKGPQAFLVEQCDSLGDVLEMAGRA